MTEDRVTGLAHGRTLSAQMLAVVVLAVVAVVGTAAAALSMLWPSTEPFYAARVADLEPLVPQHFPNERLWLVLIEDGEVRAFYDRDPRNGCPLRWFTRSYMDGQNPQWFVREAPNGMFRDPCHGSSYRPDGTAFFGPTPRGLDRYPVEVSGGAVMVHVSEVLSGPDRRTIASDVTPTPGTPP